MSLRERVQKALEVERQQQQAAKSAYYESYFEGKQAGLTWAEASAELPDVRGAAEWLAKKERVPTDKADAVIIQFLPGIQLARFLEGFFAGSRKNKGAYADGFLEGVNHAGQAAMEDEHDD